MRRPQAAAGNGTPQTGYLSCEGDRMLAVILSKAMLLAKDTEITDPTILSQLSADGCDSAHTPVPDGYRPK